MLWRQECEHGVLAESIFVYNLTKMYLLRDNLARFASSAMGRQRAKREHSHHHLSIGLCNGRVVPLSAPIMSSNDRHGAMSFEGERVKSPTGNEPKGKGSKSNLLEGFYGQSTFIATDALWSRGGGSHDSAEDSVREFMSETPGSPLSQSSRSIRSPFATSSSVGGESDVDKLIADLKAQNESLLYELDSMQQKEVDLGLKLEMAEDRLRKEIVMFEENASLRSEEESRDESNGTGRSSRSGRAKLEMRESPSNFDLQYSFTQNDEFQYANELQYTKERLAEMEAKLRQKEENRDQQDGKLEEVTKRAAEVEKKLADREEDLVQLYRFTEDLEMKHDVLEGNVIIHKKEAEDLRRQLAETQKELDDARKQKAADEKSNTNERSR